MQYKPQLQLYAHQAKAVSKIYDEESFALFMAMRTGKSAVIITEFGMKLVNDEVSNLLIIAPAGAYRTWEVELRKHMPAEVYARLWIGIWQSGKKVPDFPCQRGKVLIANVEAFSTVKECRELCEEFLQSGLSMMVVDESTTIKSHKSNRTLAICELAPLAKYRRILSGLPTPQSPLDLFSQFWFLNPRILGYSNFFKFRNQYAIMRKINVGSRKVEIVAGYKNIPDLHRRIANHNYRVRLEDCYDVPAKVYIRRDVELTPEQQRMYKELKKNATTQLSAGVHVTAGEVVTQLLRLHQLCCGHITDEQGVLHTVKSNRLNELVKLLEEYDGKAIIWCSYHHDIHAVSERLKKEYGPESVAVFYGGNVKEREQESQRFETSDQCRFMVATQGSGGRGRTWSMAGLIVYYSNTNNLEHRDQSEERASGVGKQDHVTVVDLITRGTVEEKIVHALRNKIDMAATITGDSWREWIV